MARMIHGVSASKTNKIRKKLTMSAQPCSAITLPEIGGLVTDYTQKLSGRRARHWHRALKMLARQEHPLVQIDKLFQPFAFRTHASHFEADIIGNPSSLFERYCDFHKIGSTGNLLECFQQRESCGQPLFKTHFTKEDEPWIVSVTLGSILSTEEKNDLSFQQLIQKAAEEFDLHPCETIDGLIGISYLLKRQIEKPLRYMTGDVLICTPDLLMGEESSHRAPFFEIGHRDGFNAHACPIQVNKKTICNWRDIGNGSLRLLFMTTLG